MVASTPSVRKYKVSKINQKLNLTNYDKKYKKFMHIYNIKWILSKKYFMLDLLILILYYSLYLSI
jgi:hypothetical protein